MIALAPPVDADTLRLRHIFLTMPALVLTVPQTARLLDVRADQAARLLEALEREGWLIHRMDGQYGLAQPTLD
jgi:hypothetical protein